MKIRRNKPTFGNSLHTSSLKRQNLPSCHRRSRRGRNGIDMSHGSHEHHRHEHHRHGSASMSRRGGSLIEAGEDMDYIRTRLRNEAAYRLSLIHI